MRKRYGHEDIYKFEASKFLEILNIKDIYNLSSVEYDKEWGKVTVKVRQWN